VIFNDLIVSEYVLPIYAPIFPAVSAVFGVQ